MTPRPNRKQYIEALREFALNLHRRVTPEPETPTDWDKVVIEESNTADELWNRIDEHWGAFEEADLPMNDNSRSHLDALKTIAFELNWRAYIPAVDPESGPSESDIPTEWQMRDYVAGVAAINDYRTEAELMFFISDLRGRGYFR